ncbi:MAG: dihydroorotase [Candidatus Omnitrophota bacterium]|nr:MAG: dihydroorotase [Candidatus Omnitrophota bacterium]
MKLLIKNGRIIDIKSALDAQMDLLIEEDKIIKIAKNLKIEDTTIFDAKNMVIVPGLIDLHTHLRQPGYEYKETICSGSRAAAFGGFTSICCMPNTNPIIDNQNVVEFILSEAKKCGLINIFVIGAISKGSNGKQLAEIGELKKAGVVAISDDGNPVENAEIMRRAMEYASMFGLPVISHCEDKNLSAEGVMNEGYRATVLGLKGIPRIAEIIAVARDIEIASFTKTKLHIAHISCTESVELVRQAKKRGVQVTCECCAHHFTLTEDAVTGYNTNTKINPPLRTKADIAAVKQGLKDGTIDCIVTDHAPHSEEEKDLCFDTAPFGIIGLETSLGLAITELVEKKVLTLKQLVEKMSFNPAKILEIDKGYICEGCTADITVLDPHKNWVVSKDKFVSKSQNSPFINFNLCGKAVLTIVSGKVVFKEDKEP